jgi:hypothetical protein
MPDRCFVRDAVIQSGIDFPAEMGHISPYNFIHADRRPITANAEFSRVLRLQLLQRSQ